MIKCVFLDRDGTICEDMGYLDDYRKMVIYPFAVEAVKIIKKKGYKIFVVSNQSGVARGRFGIEEAERQKQYLLEYFLKNDAEIDGYFYCPHHKDGVITEFAIKCDCRKPETGMLKKAVSLETIDKQHSYVVGDKLIDVEMAVNAGINGVLVLTGYGKEELNRCKNEPGKFFLFRDLLEFARELS